MRSKTAPPHLAAAVLASVISLSGCIAVWGEAHKIVSADANGMKIRYDPEFTSSARMAALAREHCKKFNMVAEPTSAEMPGVLLGIIEESYSCIALPPAKQ